MGFFPAIPWIKYYTSDTNCFSPHVKILPLKSEKYFPIFTAISIRKSCLRALIGYGVALHIGHNIGGQCCVSPSFFVFFFRVSPTSKNWFRLSVGVESKLSHYSVVPSEF